MNEEVNTPYHALSIPPIYVSQTHAAAANGLVVVQVAMTALVMALDSILGSDSWRTWGAYTIAGLLSFWFVVFTIGLLYRLSLQFRDRPISERHLSAILLWASIKICAIAIIYIAVWIIMLVYIGINYSNHMIQLVSLIKLGTTHLLIAADFRKQFESFSVNLVIALTYFGVGTVAYTADEGNVFSLAHVIIGCAIWLIGIIFLPGGNIVIFGGCLSLGAAAFAVYFRLHAFVVLLLGMGGAGILYSENWRELVETVGRVVALVYGDWKGEMSRVEILHDNEPLIKNVD